MTSESSPPCRNASGLKGDRGATAAAPACGGVGRGGRAWGAGLGGCGGAFHGGGGAADAALHGGGGACLVGGGPSGPICVGGPFGRGRSPGRGPSSAASCSLLVGLSVPPSRCCGGGWPGGLGQLGPAYLLSTALNVSPMAPAGLFGLHDDAFAVGLAP